MGDYRELRVWQKAHELTLDVYRSTARFPEGERFGLTAQLRRSATSVPSNLAEGSGRNSQNELVRFSRISLGSANELDYQLLLARDLEYLEGSNYEELAGQVDHVKRMLANLIGAIQSA